VAFFKAFPMRMNILGYRRSFLKTLPGILVLLLLALPIGVVLLSVSRRYPVETLIIAAVCAVCGVAIVLYIGELVVVGWVVDFLSEIGVPKIQARPDPLEYEQIGEIIVVTLRDNIATLLQCQAVQKQLNRLIDEHHCNFVLDFSYPEKISKTFREVMVEFVKAARTEAEKLGKPYRPVTLPNGPVFRVFDDRERAVEEMSAYDGHGWVVLCSVPVGIRAVSDLT
jgi:hypothetical protein